MIAGRILAHDFWPSMKHVKLPDLAVEGKSRIHAARKSCRMFPEFGGMVV
jgi:hypothetical protein